MRAHAVPVRSAAGFMAGDQIEAGKYTATCQKVTGEGALFLLDQFLGTDCQMNSGNTNEGGYAASSLRRALQKGDILEMLRPVRGIMIPFKNGNLASIPCDEELFGSPGGYEPCGRGQWDLMKERRNWIALGAGGAHKWCWLQNRSKSSGAHFAAVGCDGGQASCLALAYAGVRPVFRLG